VSSGHDTADRERVLLVEDNEHNRRIFAGVLTHFGFSVQEAEDGEEALTLVLRDPPDLVLVDLSLPVMDGWTLAGRLKQDPSLKHIPVVALTAHAMAGDRELALDAGCDEYLTKPISPKAVVAAVRRILDARAAHNHK